MLFSFEVLSFRKHAAGTSVNFAFYEEIINSDIPFIMVVYEKIFGSINKIIYSQISAVHTAVGKSVNFRAILMYNGKLPT